MARKLWIARVVTVAVAVAVAGCGSSAEEGTTGGSTVAQSARPAALLAPVRTFVDAVAARSADRVADGFATDGVVIDVSRRIEGREAIRRWAANETVTGILTVLRVVQTDGGQQRLLVRFAPGGSGGFEANYTFTVDGERIAVLDMQYA
jgi:SnoaL-like domain